MLVFRRGTPTTHLLRGVAGGRVVVALEGYNLRSIATSAAAVMAVLLGETPPLLPPLARRRAR